MTSRADLQLLQAALDAAVGLARSDLDEVLRAILALPPDQVREELLATLPALVDTYGDMVGVAAAEWYEQVRAAQVGGTYMAQVAPLAPVEQIHGTARYGAHLWETLGPDSAIALLSGAVQRYVAYAGRATVARNIARDPGKPRFARVPSGAKTCAFCLMLASRGFVYHSRETAGDMSHYHDDCDCQIAPEWAQGDVHIDGYDPDALYAQYREARAIAGSDNQADILTALRSLGVTTDAHVH